jgi:hypothetical protein
MITTFSPVSRISVLALADMPADTLKKGLLVKDKAEFWPNVFLVVARRPSCIARVWL